ncbi:MAG: short-chain fatty acyl-CoA regulator family protein [Acidobacteria bacterium]|nr:short-chain fatty acyl-CoA regulator family protein [Acidobacteriota bacterium]
MAEMRFGGKVRSLRRAQRLSQAELARRLGISASYLNLIEHNHRPLTAELLVKVAEVLPVDVKALSGKNDERVVAELLEAFGDPLFENLDVIAGDVGELATAHPVASEAILRLYQAYRDTRGALENLASKVSDQGALSGAPSRFPSDEVSDLLQRHSNYFPELEAGADALARDASLDDRDGLFAGLATHLEDTHGVHVRIDRASAMHGALRRFDPKTGVLALSEVLRRGSRNFHLAHQVGLLTQGTVLGRIAADPLLTTDEARALCRVALASYFAAAILMPYEPFLSSARRERYDVDLLGDRFRTSFEQVCHRLTTLRRPGAEGIPFHMLRVDIAGNISKHFSASGFRLARFSGACPRWNVFEAYLTPGMIRTQISQMPDGQTFFDIARTVRNHSGGFHAPHTSYAISLGCELVHARDIVYADGRDLANRGAFTEVGPTCRLCNRLDCEQRAFPPVQHPLIVNEHVRGVSFYAPPES